MFKKLIIALIVLLLITFLGGCTLFKEPRQVKTKTLFEKYLIGDYEIGDTILVRGVIESAYTNVNIDGDLVDADINLDNFYYTTEAFVFSHEGNRIILSLRINVLTKVGQEITVTGVIYRQVNRKDNTFDLWIKDVEIVKR